MANEIWIEGDLGPSDQPQGAWREIPSTGILPITLSGGEGLKRFLVKTRTRSGTESEVITLSILRKETLPDLCVAQLPESTNSRQLRLYLEGNPDETLFYRVYGDVDSDYQYHEFKGIEESEILLSVGEGEKMVTVQIKDLADNFCLKEVKTVLYDRSYDPAGVAIDGDPIWTNDLNHTVSINYDALPSDVLEIYVHGGVEGPGTYQWIPHQENINVRLSPSEGHRWVRVSFRLNGQEVGQAWDGVYLNPFIVLQGAASPYTISMSNIIELDSVTISGCAESYNNISYMSGLSCTPLGGPVNADYLLTDGSTVSVSTTP